MGYWLRGTKPLALKFFFSATCVYLQGNLWVHMAIQGKSLGKFKFKLRLLVSPFCHLGYYNRMTTHTLTKKSWDENSIYIVQRTCYVLTNSLYTNIDLELLIKICYLGIHLSLQLIILHATTHFQVKIGQGILGIILLMDFPCILPSDHI